MQEENEHVDATGEITNPPEYGEMREGGIPRNENVSSPERPKEAYQEEIERIKLRINLEGLFFMSSALPREVWSRGKNPDRFRALGSGYDNVFCPGKSLLRNKDFLSQHMGRLFSGSWVAPALKDIPDIDMRQHDQALTYRIGQIQEPIYKKETRMKKRTKKLFGFIPLGTEEYAVTKKVYGGDQPRRMDRFVATPNKKQAYSVSFRRKAQAVWEKKGRTFEEIITLIVPEDIAHEIAALIQQSPQYAASLYDALRPSWMGDETVARFEPVKFIHGIVKR